MKTQDVSAAWQTRYRAWRMYPHMEKKLLTELAQCSKEAARERFCATLQFGTGGLRGILGAGTNRMNVYTVARVTKGLSMYLRQTSSTPTCAIAYDSREKSELFARVAAATLAQEGIRVYIYPKLMPTPMLSYAVRHLRCDGGIVITASHNPAHFNGYKVYGADGCQVTNAVAETIQESIDQMPELPEHPLPQFDAFLASGQIKWIDESVDAAYYTEVQRSSLYTADVPLHVVYSPLNGAGNIPVREVLARVGNVKVTVVAEQEKPDGSFPTCPYPNPEDTRAMAMAGALAQEVGADLCLATDPDCDRVAVGVLTTDGLRLLNGNEIGVLLLEFICSQLTERRAMPQNPVAVKTIVSTDMACAVAKQYGVELRNVLTGFKYIGETIGRLEANGELNRFIFGFEESCGYLANTFVRDKDAVSTAQLVCEMTAYYKQQGKTLVQALDALYSRYGFYMNRLISHEFEGVSGMNHMRRIMKTLRDTSDSFLGEHIAHRTDYLEGKQGLPSSDVLAFCLKDGSSITIRPSGTEAKLKVYISTSAASKIRCDERLRELRLKTEQWLKGKAV